MFYNICFRAEFKYALVKSGTLIFLRFFQFNPNCLQTFQAKHLRYRKTAFCIQENKKGRKRLRATFFDLCAEILSDTEIVKYLIHRSIQIKLLLLCVLGTSLPCLTIFCSMTNQINLISLRPVPRHLNSSKQLSEALRPIQGFFEKLCRRL